MDRLLGTTMLTSVAVLAAATALANPQGGTVVGGQATITQAPGLTTIDQASHKAILNWQSFSIDKGETTRFNQPSSSAIALNRVTGNDPSQLMGKLEANGNVWLINPNGILAGPSAQINVHSFLGTTVDIPNADFLAGRYDFSIPSPDPDASVINQGTISIGETGLAGLVAPHVRNDGVIAAKLGNVILAGASTFTVDFQGDGLIQFAATSETTAGGGVQQAAVQNSGQIEAEGGTVLITASTAAGIVDNAINMDGVIEAQTIAMLEGAIVLDGGDSGSVEVAGTLDASGDDAGETGGTVKVLGKMVALNGSADVDASGDAGGGEILIGGNYQGNGPEANAKQTNVAENATINADAHTNGDGGRVIVWSDHTTGFAGGITARGGSEGGDGGFVEVSGKENLLYTGDIDVDANEGSAGSILFDPNNIYIFDSNGSDSSNEFYENEEVDDGYVAFDDVVDIIDTDEVVTNFHIASTKIEGLSGNVTLQARNNITVFHDLSLSQKSGESFTLQAGNNISIYGTISTKGGSVHFEAGSPHLPAIESEDQKVFFSKAFATTNGENDLKGSLSIEGPITTSDGNVTLIYSESLDLHKALNIGAGTVRLASSKADGSVTVTSADIFENVFGSGELVHGNANTAGPDGNDENVITLQDKNKIISTDVTVSSGFSGEISLIANEGITFNKSFKTNHQLFINGDANDDGTGGVTTSPKLPEFQVVPARFTSASIPEEVAVADSINSTAEARAASSTEIVRIEAPDLAINAGSPGIIAYTRNVARLSAQSSSGSIDISNVGAENISNDAADSEGALSALEITEVAGIDGVNADNGSIRIVNLAGNLFVDKKITSKPEESLAILAAQENLNINSSISGHKVAVLAGGKITSGDASAQDRADLSRNDVGNENIENGERGTIDAREIILFSQKGIGSKENPILTKGDTKAHASNWGEGGIFITNNNGEFTASQLIGDFTDSEEIGVPFRSAEGDIQLINNAGGINIDVKIEADLGQVRVASKGPLILESPIFAGASGTAILINTQQFNSSLAAPLETPKGRYLVYSGDVEGDTNSTPAQQFSRRYGVAYNPNDPEGDGLSPPIPAQGNFFVYENSPTLNITSAAFQGEARVNEITYGEEVALDLVVDEEGLVEGDSLEDALSDTGELSLDPDADPARAPAGDYEIVLGEEGLTSPIGYTLVFEPGTLLVNQASLVVTVNNVSREYGLENPVFTIKSASGFAFDDDVSAIESLIFETDAMANSDVGTYAIRVAELNAPNYKLDVERSTFGTLEVTPAPFTITAPSAERVEGQPNPAFTVADVIFDEEQLRAEDTFSDIIADVVFSFGADETSPPSEYDIDFADITAGAKGPNYDIDEVPGTLTVTEQELQTGERDNNVTRDIAQDIETSVERDLGQQIGDTLVQAAPVAPPDQGFEGPWGRRGRTAGLITPANQGRPEIW
ncbi:MAG: filamentous hemagglutinin N-terminal domain-containing protein [Hyphomicrobiales bacterium]|nr:filamentous hemagglutinin N-terminal domain-containing protein [Hyphomicrobiales bacterium]